MNAIASARLTDPDLVLHHALSLKQPWATLLAHGHKTIEVRRWGTAFRGRLLIHAARVPDDRPEAWAHLPEHLHEAALLGGGIVGCGTLVSCKSYRTSQSFAGDGLLHLNDPTWFEARGLFGLCFADLRPLPFHRVPGFFRVFEVELDLELPATPPPEPPVPEQTGGIAEVARRFRRLIQSLGRKGDSGE